MRQYLKKHQAVKNGSLSNLVDEENKEGGSDSKIVIFESLLLHKVFYLYNYHYFLF